MIHAVCASLFTPTFREVSGRVCVVLLGPLEEEKLVITTEPLKSDTHLKVCLRNCKVSYMAGLLPPQDDKTTKSTIKLDEI